MTEKNTFEFSSIDRFEFSISDGKTLHGRVHYAVSQQSGVYQVMIKRLNKDSETFSVDDHFIQRLSSVLKDNQVERWDGFYCTDDTAVDGCDFYLSVSNESGTFFALGYEMWPPNYDIVKYHLDTLFMSLYEKTTKKIDVKKSQNF